MKIQSEPIISDECTYLASGLSFSCSHLIWFLSESIVAFQVSLPPLFPPWIIMSLVSIASEADNYPLALGPDPTDLIPIQLAMLPLTFIL